MAFASQFKSRFGHQFAGPLSAPALGQGGGWTPASLFANGEDGFLFYPMSDLTRLFFLSDGSSGNVAADGDAVGLDLDNHLWANASLAQVMAGQANIAPAFAVGGAGYTVTNSDATHIATFGAGTLRYQSDTTSPQMNVGPSSAVWTSGKKYKITTVCTAWTSGSIKEAGTGAVLAAGVGTTVVYVDAAGNGPTVTRNSANVDLTISSITAQLVPGNHALQATGTKRPFWKANSGKPYLLFDGTDDSLGSPLLPSAAMALAFAGRIGAVNTQAMGGGAVGTNQRCYLGTGAAGELAGGWGGQNSNTIKGSADIRGVDHVGLLTADATSVDLWLDGSLVYSAASSGSPAGASNAFQIGAWANGGTPTGFMAGNLYAALALNRRVTPAEIALITSQFQRTYQ